MSNVTKEQWIEMFREIGLADEDMSKWHRLFEARHPDGHESFLKWLGLDAKSIQNIRKA
ncbi:MAG TPA: hypothetical protein PK090_02950 [Smithellaceae bacterium]|nr:hypothetical protein [Smithellaceae bacterium]